MSVRSVAGSLCSEESQLGPHRRPKQGKERLAPYAHSVLANAGAPAAAAPPPPPVVAFPAAPAGSPLDLLANAVGQAAVKMPTKKGMSPDIRWQIMNLTAEERHFLSTGSFAPGTAPIHLDLLRDLHLGCSLKLPGKDVILFYVLGIAPNGIALTRPHGKSFHLEFGLDVAGRLTTEVRLQFKAGDKVLYRPDLTQNWYVLGKVTYNHGNHCLILPDSIGAEPGRRMSKKENTLFFDLIPIGDHNRAVLEDPRVRQSKIRFTRSDGSEAEVVAYNLSGTDSRGP